MTAHSFETLAVHAGATPDAAVGARTTPIDRATAFVFEDVDHAAALFGPQQIDSIYTRTNRSTRSVLEERVAALEGGTAAVAVASGKAAQLLALHALMQPGDEFVASSKICGGSVRQFTHAFPTFDWRARWADPDDPTSFEAAISEKTRAIFVESISSSGGIVTDVAAVAEIANAHELPLIVDNTLATPYLCRPFEHGADIVIHSLNVFLSGHGHAMGGVIVDGGTFDWGASGRYPKLSEPRQEDAGIVLSQTFGNIAFAVACRLLGLRDLGPTLSPFDALLILTAMETLPLRMQRHSDNARRVAEHLSKHEKVEWVSYAGLSSDRYHALQQRYAPNGAGAVLTFGLRNGYEAAVALVQALKLFSHLPAIGDTRSLVIHPASTTQGHMSDEQRIAVRAGPEVVCLSVGIEHADDIIADLEQALART